MRALREPGSAVKALHVVALSAAALVLLVIPPAILPLRPSPPLLKAATANSIANTTANNVTTITAAANAFGLMRTPYAAIRNSTTASQPTLFFLPFRENRCEHRYNYFCKFFFHLRCHTFAAFPDLRIIDGFDAVAEFARAVRSDDIAVLIYRNEKRHKRPPELLHDLLALRSDPDTPPFRIGVLHLANELHRADWPWYPLPDFVLRNYWIPDPPPHVAYIPLAAQMPSSCSPWSTTVWSDIATPSEDTCRCPALTLSRASARPFLWTFGGSIRRHRAQLLDLVRRSPVLAGRGVLNVSARFGGDGQIGKQDWNPKEPYLRTIQESQFVFAPCGNAMETHRIYEALALGAIPVIENCEPELSEFFPLGELVVNGGPGEMVRFVERYAGKPAEIDGLQRRVVTWWEEYSIQVARDVSDAVLRHVPATARAAI